MRTHQKCPACNRHFKESHDKKIQMGKPYHKECITYYQFKIKAQQLKNE